MAKLIDMTGERFGRLVVTRFHGVKQGPSGQKYYLWECRCDCGKKTIVLRDNLRNANTKSCGCLRGRKLSPAEIYREAEHIARMEEARGKTRS